MKRKKIQFSYMGEGFNTKKLGKKKINLNDFNNFKVISMKIKNSAFPVLLFSSAFFLLYLICLCLYRINCMYIFRLGHWSFFNF